MLKKILKNWFKKQAIAKTDFIVLDTETTGFSCEKDRLISIGAVHLRDNQMFVNSVFEKYIKQPKAFYKKEGTEIHGILHSSRHIDFMCEKKVLWAFKNYIGERILIGHHIDFDMQMINMALKRHKIPRIQNKILDTGILFKRMLYLTTSKIEKRSIRLDEICTHFNIDKHARHTATGDAFITGIAFIKIIKILNASGNLFLKDLFEIPFYARLYY